jgi:hypothetical protein
LLDEEVSTVCTLKFVRSMVRSAILAPLVARSLDGDMRAWQELVTLIFPGIEEVAWRYRNVRRLPTSEDERRNIAVAVIERLRARELDGLERLRAACALGEDSGWPWICRVTQRKALDHVRDHAENLGADETGAPRFAKQVALPDEVEDLLPVSVRAHRHIDARTVLGYAERNLSPKQLAALHLHLLGDSEADIAAALHLPAAHAAHALWHGAVARLRYRFAREDGGREE